jgi:hypothetical protein
MYAPVAVDKFDLRHPSKGITVNNHVPGPGPAPGRQEKSPADLPTEPDNPLDTPVAPQPEEGPGHANAKAKPDRRAQSVEDAHVDASDRVSETESPRGSMP